MTDQDAAPDLPVNGFTSPSEALTASHHITGSWRITGAFLGLSGAEARYLALTGREPRAAHLRLTVGLPTSIETIPAAGTDVTPGSLTLTSSRTCACGCGRSFLPRTWNQVRIPGHPRRRSTQSDKYR